MSRCHLSSLITILGKLQHKPKRTLSQNFLVEELVVNKIIKSLDIHENDHVVEIGPGAGALTEKLVLHPIYFSCVEKDDQLIHLLNFEEKATLSFNIFHQDVLNFSFEKIYHNVPLKIISNLPYHLTSKILKILAKKRELIKECVLMVEKGYADDLMQAGKTKAHDATSFILHQAFLIKPLFNVSKNCFYPKPKIDSTVLSLIPQQVKPHELSYIHFLEILFHQKRKMIQSVLKNIFSCSFDEPLNKEIEQLLQLRPENLTMEQAYQIFSIFYNQISQTIDEKNT